MRNDFNDLSNYRMVSKAPFYFHPSSFHPTPYRVLLSQCSILGDIFIHSRGRGREKGTKIIGCKKKEFSRGRSNESPIPCIINRTMTRFRCWIFSDGVEDVEMTSHPGQSTDDSRMNACSEKGDNTPLYNRTTLV